MNAGASSVGGGAGGGGGTGTGTGTAGSSTQQANDITRNFILGLPKEGLNPSSEEAAELHAAEAFVSDIQQEILAYDIANARAMETYAMKWWSHVPYFGRGARLALEHAAAESQHQHQQQQDSGDADGAPRFQGGLSGLDPAQAAEAVASTGAAFLHTQKGSSIRGSFQVERTAAVDAASLDAMLRGQRPGVRAAPGKTAPAMNAWLFKKKHPGWTPLMQRWWVPWVCLGAVVLVWTPDVWKLRALYYCDWQYALLRQNVHKAYWRATMSKDDYEAVLADIEAQRPSTVKSTDCPF